MPFHLPKQDRVRSADAAPPGAPTPTVVTPTPPALAAAAGAPAAAAAAAGFDAGLPLDELKRLSLEKIEESRLMSRLPASTAASEAAAFAASFVTSCTTVEDLWLFIMKDTVGETQLLPGGHGRKRQRSDDGSVWR